MKILIGTAVGLALAAPVFAEDSTTFAVAEREEAGPHLIVNGRPVYLFSTDVRATDEESAETTCTSDDCLATWPPVSTTDEAELEQGEGIDAARLGTTAFEDRQIVTYDGWPLYHYIGDEDSGEPQGDGLEAFDGVWHLIHPVVQIHAADIEACVAMYAADCAQCHGRTGRGLASFPSLLGMDAGEVAARLEQYRAGETVGPNSPLMWSVAGELSDEDIANLAAHISINFP
jgi:cytochrome c553